MCAWATVVVGSRSSLLSVAETDLELKQTASDVCEVQRRSALRNSSSIGGQKGVDVISLMRVGAREDSPSITASAAIEAPKSRRHVCNSYCGVSRVADIVAAVPMQIGTLARPQPFSDPSQKHRDIGSLTSAICMQFSRRRKSAPDCFQLRLITARSASSSQLSIMKLVNRCRACGAVSARVLPAILCPVIRAWVAAIVQAGRLHESLSSSFIWLWASRSSGRR